MSQTKYKLSNGRRQRCLLEIQDYDETLEWYRQKRYEILNSSPKPSDTYTDHSNDTGRPVEDKQKRLEKLDGHPRVVGMFAIDNAKQLIGRDLPDNKRQKLIETIWTSCILGRRFRYAPHEEELNMCRDAFYERRRKFLWDISNRLYSIKL